MDQALEMGINFFDTANVYGWKKGEGWTEQIVGRWFAQGGGRREKVVIATKVYGGMGDWPNESKLSARHIKQACEASLRRMQTDYIDLYQMHHVDRDTPWEETWEALDRLVQEGKVLYVGSSNFAGYHIAKANEIAKNRNFMGLVSLSLGIFNLLPIPILDGGHIFLLLVEFLYRKPLSMEKRELAQKIGLLILIPLFIFVFYNDIARIIGW